MADELTVFRAADFETPLWTIPNPQAGRYNRANSPATQYLGLHPLTPWAEVLRNSGSLTKEAARELRIATWVLRISVDQEILELTFDNASDWGLNPEDLVADDLGPCQDLAQRLRDDTDAPNVLIVPSAALPGTRNMVILDERVAIDFHEEPIDIVDVPASLGADNGRAPYGLWDLVHPRNAGAPHPAFEAWAAGADFEWHQPDVRLAV